MNAHWFPTSGVNELRFASHLRNDSKSRARVVVLGSFMGGYHVLSELIFGELSSRAEVVGIATDDPTQPYTNAKVRLWRHPHTEADETLVQRFAASPAAKNITCGCQLMSWSPRYCCFDIM